METTRKHMWPWLLVLLVGVAAGTYRLARQGSSVKSAEQTASPDDTPPAAASFTAPVPPLAEQAPPPDDAHPEIGRHSIDQALDRSYPTERDHRFGLSPEPDEEEAPLAEVVAYRASRPIPHWHYTTYGLSELAGKISEDPSLSGFGVEYTLRLVDDADRPPVWPMSLLRWVAKDVWQTREPFDPNHSMNLPAGMLNEVSPGVEGLGFLEDAELGAIDTPNGRVTFVNIIPLAGQEWRLLGAWDFDKYLEVVRSQQGDLLWRIGRASVLDGELGKAVLSRAKREGSSQAIVFSELNWTDREIILDEDGRDVLIQFLRYRLAYGRDAAIVSGARRATLSPGDWRMECSEDTCTTSIPQSKAVALADALAAAAPGTVVKRPHGVQFRIAAAE